MKKIDFDDFIKDSELLAEAGKEARRRALEKGVSVFYKIDEMYVREDPDGRIYQIKLTGNDGSYEVVKEVKREGKKDD